jgi:hypothetical protein
MPIVDMQGTDLCLGHIYLSTFHAMATQYIICAHKYAASFVA